MVRPHAYATADRCRTCHAPVVTANRDVLADVTTDIEVDPTPLDPATRLACVVVGRRTYRYEVAAGQGWLGDGRVTERWMGAPDDLLPSHVCGAVFPLPLAVWWPRLDGVYLSYTSDTVPW